MQSGPLILLDTNFFKSATSSLSAESFWQKVSETSEAGLNELLEEWTPLRTPFSILEWIGVNTRGFPLPEKFSPRSRLGFEILRDAWDFFTDHFRKIEQLSDKSLHQRVREQLQMTQASQKIIAQSSVERIEHNLGEWVHTALVFDAVNKLEVPQSVQGDYERTLLRDGFYYPGPIVRNFSKLRLAKRLWPQIPAIKTKLIPQSVQDAMHSLKNRKDFFDTDLIHLAVNGIEDEIGFRSSIICLTQDAPTEIENRLRIYKGLIFYVKEQFETEMLAAGYLPLEADKFNGRVFCFDKVGGLVRHFDVAKDITPFLFSF